MRIRLFILIFLFLSAFLIISNSNLHLKNANEARNFGNLYYSWLLGLAGNTVKTTAYVIGFNWLPDKVSQIDNLTINNKNITLKNSTK